MRDDKSFGPEDVFSPVGFDEEIVREYIRNQEEQDEHREQLKFGM